MRTPEGSPEGSPEGLLESLAAEQSALQEQTGNLAAEAADCPTGSIRAWKSGNTGNGRQRAFSGDPAGTPEQSAALNDLNEAKAVCRNKPPNSPNL